jgi:putative ABC transport system substrate-binding protein
VLLLTIALLSTLGWTGESWGQAKIPHVGILSFGWGATDDAVKQRLEPFRRTLADQGWIEGKNVSFEYRSTSDPSQLAEFAAELVWLKVDVIFAINAPGARGAYAATITIPIVALDFTSDPVAEGHIESYGRPGGNITGVFLDAPRFAGKWLELLKAVVPGLTRIVVLWDPGPGPGLLQAVRSVARSSRLQIKVLELRKPDDIDRDLSALPDRPQAIIILPSLMTFLESGRLAKLAMKHRLLATSMFSLFAEADGALAYGPEQASSTERCAILVARILGGAKPADLPVERPTKFELVVNLKTTKDLGLKVPDSVLVRADEVIR